MANPLNIYDFLDIRQKIKENPAEIIPEIVESDSVNPFRFHLTESVFVGAAVAVVAFFWNKRFTEKVVNEYVKSADDLPIELAGQILSFLKTQSMVFSWLVPFLLIFSGFITSIIFNNKKSGVSRSKIRRYLYLYHGSHGIIPAILFSILFIVFNQIMLCVNLIRMHNPEIQVNPVSNLPEIIDKYAIVIFNDPFKLAFNFIAVIASVYLLYIYLVKAPFFISKVQKVKYSLGKYLFHGIVWSGLTYACFALFYMISIFIGLGSLSISDENKQLDWQRFDSSDERFSVQMPLKPKEDHFGNFTLLSGREVPRRIMELGTSKANFNVYWATHPDFKNEYSELIPKYEKILTEKDNAKILQKDKLSEYEILYVCDYPDEKSAAFKIIVVDDTIYIITTLTKDENINEPFVMKFINSFKVINKIR